MVGVNTKHGGDNRHSGNTKLKPRKPPMQVRKVQPAKKLLTKSLGSLSFTFMEILKGKILSIAFLV